MITTDAYIPARKQLRGRTRKVRLVVMHATQSPERRGAARSVANWFADPRAKGSAHVTCDDRETIESVKPHNTAAGAPGANQDGYHIEQVGYSEQGEPEWMDAYSQAVIARAATAAREACDLFGVPKVWLSIEDVRAGRAGITDHNTITKAMRKGSHWDPGPHWPRAQFMALVHEEEDMTPEQSARLDRVEAKLDLVIATIADDEQSATTKRNTIAALFRRCLGIPLMADGVEQHKADEDTGRRLQALLGE